MVKALTIAILVFPIVSFAEVKEIISEGTYNMGDGETPIVAEGRALIQAKRAALEQSGTYVSSYSKVKNFQLIEDEIQVLTSGTMEIETLDQKRAIIGDGAIKFWVKIKAKISTDTMEEMAKRVKEKSILEDYRRIQEAYDKSQQEIQALKKQLAATKTAQGKKKIKTEIAANEKMFQVNEWLDKGYHYSLNKEYDKSIKALSSAIKLAPNHQRAYLNRGYAYNRKGQYDLAIEDFNKAITIKPDGLAYIGRGMTYAEKGQYDRAIEDYSKAIATDLNIHVAYNVRGNAYIKKGQYDLAIEDFNKAITINPNNYSDYGFRGHAYNRKGQYDRAIEDFNKAIAISPTYAEGYLNRGTAYYGKGQPDQAIEDFNKAITINPNYDLAYYNRGIAYGGKGQLDRAIIDYDKAIVLNPNNADAYLNRGNAYGGKGQNDKEIEDYNKAIAINPNFAMAYYNRATVYYNQGQYSRAVEDYNKAIAINPNYIDAYYNRGNAYSKLKAYDRALADIKTAARLGDKKAQDVLKELEMTDTNIPYGKEALPSTVSSIKETKKLADEVPDVVNNKLVFIPFINSRIKGVRFFESNRDDAPPIGNRIYQNSFLKKDTRTIYWELQLEHSAPRRSIEFQVIGVWYDPTGKEFFRNSLDAKILDNWPSSASYGGWGWKDFSASNWLTGTYRVDLYISGNKIASGTFEIH